MVLTCEHEGCTVLEVPPFPRGIVAEAKGWSPEMVLGSLGVTKHRVK